MSVKDESMDEAEELEELRTILDSPSLEEHWNRSYGLTDRRARSLIKGEKHANSYYNRNSETALTFFLFGNLDGWKQMRNLDVKPRDKNCVWREDFFSTMRENGKIYRYAPGSHRWSNFLSYDKKSLDRSILLFEFEITNKAFNAHKGGTFKEHSFLDTSGLKTWSRFDAVLIIPEERKFEFFECKLDEDISRSVKRYPMVDQLIRALESAFLLTNHEKSPYRDWDFHMNFICPRVINQYGLTYYDRFIENIGDFLVRYNDILNHEYADSIDPKIYPEYFGPFIKEVRDRLSLRYWDELADAILKDEEDFFNSYFESLKDIGIEEIYRRNIESRFRRADIKT